MITAQRTLAILIGLQTAAPPPPRPVPPTRDPNTPGCHYQFVFARNAGHTDRTVKQQILAAALEWLGRGYR